MAAKAEPAAVLYVANQAATFFVDGREVIIYPGLIVRHGNPVWLARQSLFEPLVIEVAYETGLPISEGASVMICGDSEGAGFGSEVVSVRRFRTKAAPVW